MSCTLEDELTAYVDGELGAAEASRVRAHLAGCAHCRATEALLRRAVDSLSALPAFEPSLGLRRSVLGQLDNVVPFRQRLRGWLSPALLVPSAAGLLAAAGVAVLVTAPLRHSRVPAEFSDPSALDVAMNFDVVRDYHVLGLEKPEDVEVVAMLDELEAKP
jgi:anti-sigma factor RsiW